MPETALNSIVWITAAISLSMPLAGFAQEAGRTSDEYIFNLLDMDRNGEVDRPEFVTQKMLVFSVLDANQDLKLTPSEIPAFSAEDFARMDADSNGELSPFEFNQAANEEMFVLFDRNRDGVITLDEMRAFRTAD
jgi:Ca2+-binding EF-hand superfamily protein